MLEQALEMALKLPPKERLRLIAQIAASVEIEMGIESPSVAQWGQALNVLIAELDKSDKNDAATPDDPLAWLKGQRF